MLEYIVLKYVRDTARSQQVSSTLVAHRSSSISESRGSSKLVAQPDDNGVVHRRRSLRANHVSMHKADNLGDLAVGVEVVDLTHVGARQDDSIGLSSLSTIGLHS